MLKMHKSMWSGELGEIQAPLHRVDLIRNARPVRSHPYWAGPKAREAEDLKVKGMLKAGVIELAPSEWASPVVLLPKPDGSSRFWVDDRRLNVLTVKDT